MSSSSEQTQSSNDKMYEMFDNDNVDEYKKFISTDRNMDYLTASKNIRKYILVTYPEKIKVSKEDIYRMIRYRNFESLGLLIEKKIIRGQNLDRTMCHLAERGYEFVIKYLSLDDVNENKVLGCAVNYGQTRLVNKMIDYGLKLSNKTIEIMKKKEEQRITERATYEWIRNWIKDSSVKNKININPKIIQELKKTIKDDNITIYRGLSWSSEEFKRLNTIDFKSFDINNIVSIEFPKISSWSKSLEFAMKFAHTHYSKTAKRDSGLVVEINANRNQILADISKYDNVGQQEIIMNPGKFDCKIIFFRINEHNFGSNIVKDKFIKKKWSDENIIDILKIWKQLNRS